MDRYERAVRFEEVDAAGIVFFARFFHYAHEAMEHVFSALPGGYVDLIVRRRVGFPAVHVTSDFEAPLRFGDALAIDTTVTKLGTTSATFRYAMTRARDAVLVATIEHVTVATNLDTMTKLPLPPDVRALLTTHPP